MKRTSRALLAVLFSLTPLAFAQDLAFSLMFAGFPDSHVTEYDTAVELPRQVLIWVSFAAALYLIYRAFRVKDRRGVVHLGVILLSYVLLFVSAKRAVDFYLKDYLQLDFGQGG
jgi:hypothetical protein